MKKMLAVLILALVAAPVLAQQVRTGHIAVRYDLDATTMTFCTSNGEDDRPWAARGKVPYQDYKVDNGGSSTAVTSANAGEDVFLGMAAGDLLLINVDGTITPRTILTYTDTENIVVDEAIDLSAADYSFTWRDHTCGTTAADGWLALTGNERTLVTFLLVQYAGDGNGIDVRLEGGIATQDGTDSVVQLWPTGKTVGGAATVQNFTTAGIATNVMIDIPERVDRIRLGMKHNQADDGNDLTTNAEQITVMVQSIYVTH